MTARPNMEEELANRQGRRAPHGPLLRPGEEVLAAGKRLLVARPRRGGAVASVSMGARQNPIDYYYYYYDYYYYNYYYF